MILSMLDTYLEGMDGSREEVIIYRRCWTVWAASVWTMNNNLDSSAVIIHQVTIFSTAACHKNWNFAGNFMML